VSLFIEAAMAGVEAPLIVPWQACGRDKRGGRRRGTAGGAAWGEGQQGSCRGGAMGGGGTAPVVAWSLFYVRAGRKQEGGERRGKKKTKEKKGKKYGNFSKHGKYLKNKR
jgi:hypothetical protein